MVTQFSPHYGRVEDQIANIHRTLVAITAPAVSSPAVAAVQGSAGLAQGVVGPGGGGSGSVSTLAGDVTGSLTNTLVNRASATFGVGNDPKAGDQQTVWVNHDTTPYALGLEQTSASWTGVAMRFGTGQVGVLGGGWEWKLLDKSDISDVNGNAMALVDLYRGGLKRIIIDRDGQFRVETASGNTAAVNSNLLIAASSNAGAVSAGFGVGLQAVVVDSTGTGVSNAGFISCVTDAVTPGAVSTRWDIYNLKAGAGQLVLSLHSDGSLAAGAGTFSGAAAPSKVAYRDANAGGSPIIFRFERTTSATPGAFVGQEVDFVVPNAAGNPIAAASDFTQLTVVTAGAENGAKFWQIMLAGVSTEALKLQTRSTHAQVKISDELAHAGTTAGFYGTTPVTKPTVTGSRAANAALASLLTALASQGLLVDSSTV